MIGSKEEEEDWLDPKKEDGFGWIQGRGRGLVGSEIGVLFGPRKEKNKKTPCN